MRILFIILGLIANVQAKSLEACFIIAANHYKIPIKLLKAIAKTETKMDPFEINLNSNHSYDIGIMQINSYWLPKLRKIGIRQVDLFDGCTNIQVGSWILAQNIKQYGFSRQAIGAYNSTDPALQERYYRKVARYL